MGTLVKITIAWIMTLLLASCGFDLSSGTKGNGKVIEEKREVPSDFTEISVSEGLQARVTQSEGFELAVEADENIIDLIGTKVVNGRLKIYAIENIGRATKTVFVALPEITLLKGSSGAHLVSEGLLKGETIELNGSSGAMLSVEVDARAVDLEASKGAQLYLSGRADRAKADVSSGGQINARDLQTTSCTAGASSGGQLKIRVSESLTANASSGGTIAYSGEPELTMNKSVSGSVIKD